MQFGRCSDLTQVDFSLPALRARSAAMLVRAAAEPPEPWLRLGAPAFRHRDWLGGLYPAGVDAAEWLRIYASKLAALELNSTFYGLPSEATIARWVADTPPEFRFCPKLPRAISHELGSSELQGRVVAFVQRMELLGQRLGPSLCQLPESAGPDVLPQLRAALDVFPDDFALALEVRHAAWFERGALHEALLEWMEGRGIASVITDVSGRRDASHASLSTPTAFVRFVGEGGHETDEPRVARWMERLQSWQALGLHAAYFFVHQPDDIAAPALLSIAAEYARGLGIDVPSVVLERPAPSQLGLFG